MMRLVAKSLKCFRGAVTSASSFGCAFGRWGDDGDDDLLAVLNLGSMKMRVELGDNLMLFFHLKQKFHHNFCEDD